VNWLPACSECNRLKNAGRKVLVPRGRVDPRDFLAFDITTGAPEIGVSADARKQRVGASTIATLRLDHPVLNDARRVQRQRMVALLLDVANRKKGAAAEALDMLRATEPHRAILRELILETDAVLNPHASMVARAVRELPELRRWARRPR
jgi:hypothetical protein